MNSLKHQDSKAPDLLLPRTSAPGSPSSSVFDLPTQNAGPMTPIAMRPKPPAIHTQALERSDQGTGPKSPKSKQSYVVISGGTGGNAICACHLNACYVLPVSDDGGSSSEIIRVLGGPSIGDIRSRLVRLIPPAPPRSPLDAIRKLLAHRLPAHYSERQARDEWRDIAEGRSTLWEGIPTDRKETIRGFLVYFESEVLKRAHKNFTFVNGSIGNYFIAAAQGFFRSLPSAIFLFSSITNSQANILPVVVTNHTVTIAADLENGERLVGQCEISHPVPTATTTETELPFISINAMSPHDEVDGMDVRQKQRQQNVMFEPEKKDYYEPLSARISRLLYINAYGMEIHPNPNPDYIASLNTNDVLVYSCGSLWTSIMPCLAFRGVASAIARSHTLKAKVLLLNSQNDRETDGYTAVDYILAIARTLNSQYQVPAYGLGNTITTYPTSAFITDLVYLKGGLVNVDVKRITTLGVRCTEVTPDAESRDVPKFTVSCVKQAIEEILARPRT
ncbi:UPF0052-domain-containing protein [Dendrothele bispora CBS 962.96]|uniref:UPF0052-domain-containing protein n=1 Tax=Dendrothele bispora (strain CBS 962.96) TaxID=1314807 RepID=A0A4S8LFJ7_DENBC|nr:UPF0052-domain-containing protein [Dendrothele bispora CBS 962.96]THU89454.1 UPF0052-domain-containing protein [Dendrothele bispora CBS 962.96]